MIYPSERIFRGYVQILMSVADLTHYILLLLLFTFHPIHTRSSSQMHIIMHTIISNRVRSTIYPSFFNHAASYQAVQSVLSPPSGSNSQKYHRTQMSRDATIFMVAESRLSLVFLLSPRSQMGITRCFITARQVRLSMPLCSQDTC